MADRHFLVVGGSRGIGRELVKHLLSQEGCLVSVFGRSCNPSEQTPRLSQYAIDVGDRRVLLSAIDRAVQQFGKIVSVVFLQRHRGKKDEYEQDIAVALGTTRNAIEHLVERRYFSDVGASNSIVMVSSVADHYIAPEQPLGYHLGKAGLTQMARFYALELGPLGIRVNTVSPCVVAKDEAKAFYDNNAWLVDRYEKLIPLGRMGRPQDIVNAIMFLSSDQAGYITGQNIVVDGGLTLRSHQSLINDISHGG